MRYSILPARLSAEISWPPTWSNRGGTTGKAVIHVTGTSLGEPVPVSVLQVYANRGGPAGEYFTQKACQKVTCIHRYRPAYDKKAITALPAWRGGVVECTVVSRPQSVSDLVATSLPTEEVPENLARERLAGWAIRDLCAILARTCDSLRNYLGNGERTQRERATHGHDPYPVQLSAYAVARGLRRAECQSPSEDWVGRGSHTSFTGPSVDSPPTQASVRAPGTGLVSVKNLFM